MKLELFLPTVKCDECGKETYEPMWIVRHTGQSTVQYVFCCKSHIDAFFIKRLNNIKTGEGYVPEL